MMVKLLFCFFNFREYLVPLTPAESDHKSTRGPGSCRCFNDWGLIVGSPDPSLL